MALTLGGFAGFDAHTRFALGRYAGFLDLALMIALSLDLRFLFLALAALGVFFCADARVLGALDGVRLFLDAVLLDLAELAQREQNRIFALLTLCHGWDL
ncbi:MAG TPA: hypothetical protein VL326_25535 [Kofleriaceae bacterium]|nr:hypothetical protein [Kofleriaceae bacterium]